MTSRRSLLILGCGNMGRGHAHAAHQSDDFDVVGLISRGPKSRERLAKELGGLPTFSSLEESLTQVRPDAVCISTYPDTHAELSIQAMKEGIDVFVEKPIAPSLEEGERMLAVASETGKKLYVGYILRAHPVWQQWVSEAKKLGAPCVMRITLNQRTHGSLWETQKNLLSSVSPVVDSGVHYVDLMLQICESKPVRVSAIAAQLDATTNRPNYGQLQVQFEDGSVGWFEAGWGPMMGENSRQTREVVGPHGSAALVTSHGTTSLRIHQSRLKDGQFAERDQKIESASEPDFIELCRRQLALFRQALDGELDMKEHHQAVLESQRIVLASDEAAKTGKLIELR